MTSQNTRGEATTPITRLFCRQKRTSSRCHSVAAGRTKLFIDGCSCLAHEDIFQGGLMQSDGIDLARKGLHYLSDEPMPVRDLDPELRIDHLWLDPEARA